MALPVTQILHDGYVIIPKEFRKSFELNEGDLLDVSLRNDEIVFRPQSNCHASNRICPASFANFIKQVKAHVLRSINTKMATSSFF